MHACSKMDIHWYCSRHDTFAVGVLQLLSNYHVHIVKIWRRYVKCDGQVTNMKFCVTHHVQS